MSKENLEQFMNQIAESEELQAKIGEEIDAEALIALGAECGCEFTAEELQESAELSDDELDTVSGGRQGPKSKKQMTTSTGYKYLAESKAWSLRFDSTYDKVQDDTKEDSLVSGSGEGY